MDVILLTGATGLVGTAVLRRLVGEGDPVRCLVRDPRRLGEQRVRVQLAMGDLADPPSFRNAMRGVSTVIHLAAAARDQTSGSIEELNGIATWRMVRAAERAGVRRFVFISVLGASRHHRTRLLRAKALAEDVVAASSLDTQILASSLIYAPGDRALRLLQRASFVAPAMPMVGGGHASFQPIWADDVADCVLAAMRREVPHERHELAGPGLVTQRELLELQLRAVHRRRRVVPVPEHVVSGGLRIGENLLKSKTPVCWDEAELLTTSMTSAYGTAGAEALGVSPATLEAVLGLPPVSVAA